MTSIEELVNSRLKGISLENLLSLKITKDGEDTYFPKRDAKPFLQVDVNSAYNAGFDFEFDLKDQCFAYLKRTPEGYSFSQRVNPYLAYLVMSFEEKRSLPLHDFNWERGGGVRAVNSIIRHMKFSVFNGEKPSDYHITVADFYDHVFENEKKWYLSIHQFNKKSFDVIWQFYSDIGMPLPNRKINI